MSRFGDYDGDGDDEFNGNGWAMWQKRAELALRGKRGRKALAELRDALMALPEKRLIEGALCTVGLDDRLERIPKTVVRAGSYVSWLEGGGYAVDWAEGPFIVENPEFYDVEHALNTVDRGQGEGVCAIGAYVWWQKVKAGMDPAEAFASVPIGGEGAEDTVDAGKAAGLTWTLAWELANMNDEQWGDLTPEQRHRTFLAFIDRQLALPPLEKPAPRVKRERVRKITGAAARAMRRPPVDAPGLGL